MVCYRQLTIFQIYLDDVSTKTVLAGYLNYLTSNIRRFDTNQSQAMTFQLFSFGEWFQLFIPDGANYSIYSATMTNGLTNKKVYLEEKQIIIQFV